MKVLSKALSIFTSVLPMALFCICGGENALFMALAVAVHECAHLAALKACGGRICGFFPAPFGLRIVYDESSLSLANEIFVTAAGCIVNLLTAIAAAVCYRFFALDLITFGIVNALVALMNLLPIAPLDGGRLLHLAVSAICSPHTADRCVYTVSYIFGFVVFVAASYLLVTSQSGIYPLLFSIYIFAENAKMGRESDL